MRIDKFVVVAASAAALLCAVAGCATPHTITLSSGDVIETKDEPKLNVDSGFYEFEEVSGKKVRLNKDEIQKIESN
jgi:hypothetical protein